MLKKIRVLVIGVGAIITGLALLFRDTLGIFADAGGDAPLDELAIGMIGVGVVFLLMLFTTVGKRLALFLSFGAIAAGCFAVAAGVPMADWGGEHYAWAAGGLVAALGALILPFAAVRPEQEPQRRSSVAKELGASAAKKALKDWIED